jgi:hypothetical protein
MIVSLSWCSVVVAFPTETSVVGVRQGDSAMYVGAPPSEEYEWIQISVLQIRGSMVNLSLRYDVRARFRLLSSYYYPDHPHFVSIDVAEGTSNYFFFVIPRNLTIGDVVPVPEAYPRLKVEGVEQRKYAGADRTVVFASFSNMTVRAYDFKTAGRYYWDKDTGLLVEMVATIGGIDVTCEKLTGTSLWSAELGYWLADNYPILIMLAFVIGAFSTSAVFLLRMRKKMAFRVTHPNMGIALLVVGVAVVAGGILNMSSFGQLTSSLCFAFAPSFLVGGVLSYTGGWATLHKNKFVLDLGILMIATAIVLGGIVIACMTYRHLEVFVPYVEGEPYG